MVQVRVQSRGCVRCPGQCKSSQFSTSNSSSCLRPNVPTSRSPGPMKRIVSRVHARERMQEFLVDVSIYSQKHHIRSRPEHVFLAKSVGSAGESDDAASLVPLGKRGGLATVGMLSNWWMACKIVSGKLSPFVSMRMVASSSSSTSKGNMVEGSANHLSQGGLPAGVELLSIGVILSFLRAGTQATGPSSSKRELDCHPIVRHHRSKG